MDGYLFLVQNLNFNFFKSTNHRICICCQQEINICGIVCQECYTRTTFISNRCKTCGEPLQSTNLKIKSEICNLCILGRKNWFLNEVYSIFLYSGVGRQIILNLKKTDNMFDYEVLTKLALKNDKEFFDNIDIIIPIHLHWIKRLTRGFDQAQLLAINLSNTTHIPLKTNVLRKIKKTSNQHHQLYEKRFSNVANSFFIINCDTIKNKNILLVDDVITSGATSNQCAKILKMNSANSVKLFTLARTIQEKYD